MSLALRSQSSGLKWASVDQVGTFDACKPNFSVIMISFRMFHPLSKRIQTWVKICVAEKGKTTVLSSLPSSPIAEVETYFLEILGAVSQW